MDTLQRRKPLQEEKREQQQETPLRCGLFCWRPDFLQAIYNWKMGLAIFCWFSFLNGFLANGLQGVNTSHLERRFGIESQDIGWFVSANMFSLASTTIVTSYFAERTSNKPRMLAFAAFCYVIGSILMASPHFALPPYENPTERNPALCEPNNKTLLVPTGSGNSSSECLNEDDSSYFNLLISGNVIQGIGAAIVWTTGVAFIDDFSTTEKSGLNIGIAYLVNAIGTGVGFGVGSVFLRIDVNFDKPGAVMQNESDPTFVGAWWLGYAICIGLFTTVVIGFFFFDRELPETATLRPEKLEKNEAHAARNKTKTSEAERGGNFFGAVANFGKHLFNVFTNPVALWVTLSLTFQSLPVSGLQSFLVKLLQAQYGTSEMSAAVIVAVLIVVGIASACFLSGLMSENLGMSVRSLLLVTIVFTLLSTFLSFMELLICSQEKLAGITFDLETSSYYPVWRKKFNATNFLSPCNSNCGCEATFYTPVCDTKNVVEFFSPCHAGCLSFGKISETSFRDCTCAANSSTVSYGNCSTEGCPVMYIGIIGLFFMLFCGFFILVPTTQIIMRTVPLEQRSFSLAFNQALQYFLGNIPGPVLIGALFDEACLLRQPKPCKNEKSSQHHFGACVAYDTDDLAWWLTAILCCFNFSGCLCLVIAFVLYKPPNRQTLGEYFCNLRKWWINKALRLCGKSKSRASSVASSFTRPDEEGKSQ